MNAARGLASAGQGDVEGFGGQLELQRGIAQGFAARIEGAFDLILGRIDGRAGAFALVGGKLAQALQQVGEGAGLAQIAGLDLFQPGGFGGSGEFGLGGGYEGIEIVHGRC